MSDLGIRESLRQPESFLKALFATMGASLSGAASWTREMAAVYAQRVMQVSLGLAIVALCSGVLYAGGVYFKQAWMLVLAVIVCGVAVSLFMLVTLPVWALAAKFAEIQSIRAIVRAIGFLLLMTFLVALAFMVIPITGQTAVIVPFGAAIIALLGALYGIGPDPRSIYAKVTGVMIAAVGVSIFSVQMPQTFQQVRDLAKPVDAIISGGFISVYKPNRLILNSAEQLRSYDFFDPRDGKPRVWYYWPADGSVELFDREGMHPTTGERLNPVDRGVVKRLLQDAEKRDADARRKSPVATPPIASRSTAPQQSSVDPALQPSPATQPTPSTSTSSTFPSAQSQSAALSQSQIVKQLPVDAIENNKLVECAILVKAGRRALANNSYEEAMQSAQEARSAVANCPGAVDLLQMARQAKDKARQAAVIQ